MRLNFPMTLTQVRFQQLYEGEVTATCDSPAVRCGFTFRWEIFEGEDGCSALTMSREDGKIFSCDTRQGPNGMELADAAFLDLFMRLLCEGMYQFQDQHRTGDNEQMQADPTFTLLANFAYLVPGFVAICTPTGNSS